MFNQCPSRGLTQGGKPCQGTGARTGRAITTSMDKVSHSKSPPVMEGLSLATTWFQEIGNLDRHLRVVNSRFLLLFFFFFTDICICSIGIYAIVCDSEGVIYGVE